MDDDEEDATFDEGGDDEWRFSAIGKSIDAT